MEMLLHDMWGAYVREMDRQQAVFLVNFVIYAMPVVYLGG